MTTDVVLLPNEVRVSKLKYGKMKTLDHGGQIVGINYGSDRLTIQTPLVRLPFGVNDNLNAAYNKKDGAGTGAGVATAPTKYDLNLGFDGADDNPNMREFLDKMLEIEKKIIDDVFENRVAWLKDNFDDDKKFVAKLMYPMVKYDKDKTTGKIAGKYPPSMKIKLPYDPATETFRFDALDMEDNELNFAEVKDKLRGTRALLMIQLTGLCFVGSKYSCMWKLVMGKFQKQVEGRRFNFRSQAGEKAPAVIEVDSDDGDLDEDLIAEVAPVAAPAAKKKTAAAAPPPPPTQISESEDEDAEEEAEDAEEAEEEDAEEEVEESEEDIPTPPPPPPPPAPKKAAAKTATKAKK